LRGREIFLPIIVEAVQKAQYKLDRLPKAWGREFSNHFLHRKASYDKIKMTNRNLEERLMDDFSINEMQEMQKRLQDKYKDRWEPISPETGKNKMLWMIGEIGEVIDIIKKHGDLNASEDAKLRGELVEEMADVLMYYNDVMLCYGISADELKRSYIKKFEKNMKRW